MTQASGRAPLPPARLFEWMTSGMMVGISIIAFLDPSTIEHGGFHYLQRLWLTPDVIAFLFLIGGAGRGLALWANGHWPIYGPRMRVGAALMGAAVWVLMMHSLIVWSAKAGYVSIGVAVYFFLGIGELVSCYRAAADGRCFAR